RGRSLSMIFFSHSRLWLMRTLPKWPSRIHSRARPRRMFAAFARHDLWLFADDGQPAGDQRIGQAPVDARGIELRAGHAGREFVQDLLLGVAALQRDRIGNAV